MATGNTGSSGGANHLIERGSTWTTRREVAVDRRDQLGEFNLKAAFDTSRPRDAERLAKTWSARVDAGLTALRTGLVAFVEDLRGWHRQFAGEALQGMTGQVDGARAEITTLDPADAISEAYGTGKPTHRHPTAEGELCHAPPVEGKLRLRSSRRLPPRACMRVESRRRRSSPT
jgi:hypothetical protein